MTYLYDDGILSVEDSLFPMRVFGLRTRAEPNRFMTCFKSNVKPCNNSMNKVLSRSTQLKVGSEFEIVDSTRIQVEIENLVRIRDKRLEIHCVDEGFAECYVCNWREIETVY